MSRSSVVGKQLVKELRRRKSFSFEHSSKRLLHSISTRASRSGVACFAHLVRKRRVVGIRIGPGKHHALVKVSFLSQSQNVRRSSGGGAFRFGTSDGQERCAQRGANKCAGVCATAIDTDKWG